MKPYTIPALAALVAGMLIFGFAMWQDMVVNEWNHGFALFIGITAGFTLILPGVVFFFLGLMR